MNTDNSRRASFKKRMSATNVLRRFPELSPTSVRKTVWPELIGMNAQEAKNELLKDGSPLRVQLVPLDDIEQVTPDYQPQRVQIFFDEKGRVPWAPQLG